MYKISKNQFENILNIVNLVYKNQTKTCKKLLELCFNNY